MTKSMTVFEDPEMRRVLITEHAYERAKERFGWRPKTLIKMAELALDEGLKHGAAKGSLMRYMNKVWLTYKQCNNMRVYGENIYLFSGRTLVTIYQLPTNLKKHIKYSTKD